MTEISKKPYKGCRDFFPQLKREQNFVFNKMHQVSNLYAYEPYDGPMLEEVELYKAKSGEELINDQIYSFTDRGKREVAIRPEMTPTLARMVASTHRETVKPIRWYSIPNLMRYEKPQRGRLREHWQFNCDIFGAPEVYGEAEVLNVLKDLLKSFGANEKHFSIQINDRKIVEYIFKEINSSAEINYKLYKVIDKAKKVSSEKLKVMISELLNTEDSEKLYNFLKIKNFEELREFLPEDFESDLLQLLNILKETDLMKYLNYDPTIVRGLDYYTGIVFEAFDLHPDNKRAICGGGAYANLLQIFNEPALSGVGFGLGDVTLCDFLKTHDLMPDFQKNKIDFLVSFQDDSGKNLANISAGKLRALGFSVETLFQPIKVSKVFKYAEKKNTQIIVFIGTDEVQKEEISLRNSKKENFQIKINEITKEKIREIYS